MAAAALVLVLAGCGKLSASAAAQNLEGYLSTGYHVRCDSLSDPYWDYMCKVTPPHGAKAKAYRVKLRVGPKQILDRVYCGKQGSEPSAPTLAQTKC